MTVMLSVVGTGLLMMLQLANCYGIPSFDQPTGPVQSFPGSGDVFVTKYADLSRGQSTFSVSVPPPRRCPRLPGVMGWRLASYSPGGASWAGPSTTYQSR